MSDQHKTTKLVAELEAAAFRWWMPTRLSRLLLRAAVEIETRAEMEEILRAKLDVARGEAVDA